MKSVAGLLAAVVLLASIGVVALGAAAYERDVADAQEQLSTLRYAAAEAKLDDAARSASYVGWVPRLGPRLQRDLEARRASIRYWKREYDAVLPREADPVGAVDAANVDLQLVVANAAYRSAQGRVRERTAMIQALDEAIGSYMSVLKNDTWHADAAFNYEYLVRVRDEVARGRRRDIGDSADSGDLGEQGSPVQNSDTKKFEIYVPLEGAERTETGEAGKGQAIQKKG